MMKPYSSLLSLLLFVVGSMAKGRSGGGGGSISIDDGWDVPGDIKAGMAFEIIWFIITLGLFITILRRLRFVPPGRYTRAPYILLAVLTGPLALSWLLEAIYTRVSTSTSRSISTTGLQNLNSVLRFLSIIDLAFRPGVCLWLVHLRGNLARVTQAKTSKPWVSQFWKRVTDWSLVTMVFLFYVSNMAVTADMWNNIESLLFSGGYRSYLNARRGLGFTGLAFYLLQSINITVSFIALKRAQKSMNFIDPVCTRLLAAVLPFVVIDFLESLVLSIYPEVNKNYTGFGIYLVDIIINGLCRVGIIGGLLSTMTIPNALWVPAAAPPGAGEKYVPLQPQQPQQSFYQPPWQNSPSMPAPGQYPHPGQYSPPQNPPPAHQTYVIPNNP